MKIFLIFFILFVGSRVTFAADRSCNDLLSGDPLALSIHDLAKLRFELDLRKAEGLNDAVIRSLEAQYAQKESEVFALGGTRERIQAEIKEIQRSSDEIAESERQVRETQSDDVIQAKATVEKVGHLSSDRYGHAAILLPNNRMLIWGGSVRDGFLRPELYDVAKNQSTTIDGRSRARSGATLFLMSDGQVVISGGSMGTTTISEIERYDPQTGNISTLGSWKNLGINGVQVRLPDGRIAAVAGRLTFAGMISDRIEAYDFVRGQVEPIGRLSNPRQYHSVTVLSDGALLVIGGEDAWGYLSSIERFDPTKPNSVGMPIANLPQPIADPASVLLHDGRVAIVGGRGEGAKALSSIEIFDPDHNTCLSVAELHRARIAPFVKTLSDGRVVVIGGRDSNGLPVPGMEVFDPDSNTVEAIDRVVEAKSAAAIAVSPDDEIWISGGSIERIKVGRR